MEGQLEEYYL